MKDTVGDFDDMANAFPQWSKVPLVAQTDLITLHQPHIYNWYTDISLRLCYWYSSWKILYITIQIPKEKPTKQNKKQNQKQLKLRQTKQTHSNMQQNKTNNAGSGRLRAILMTDGGWEWVLFAPHSHWEDVKIWELPPESVLGSVK